MTRWNCLEVPGTIYIYILLKFFAVRHVGTNFDRMYCLNLVSVGHFLVFISKLSLRVGGIFWAKLWMFARSFGSSKFTCLRKAFVHCVYTWSISIRHILTHTQTRVFVGAKCLCWCSPGEISNRLIARVWNAQRRSTRTAVTCECWNT